MRNIKSFENFSNQETNEGKLSRALGAAALGATLMGSPKDVKAETKDRIEYTKGPGDSVLITHPSDLSQLMINGYIKAKSRGELVDIIEQEVRNKKQQQNVIDELDKMREDIDRTNSLDDAQMYRLGKRLINNKSLVDRVKELASKYKLNY